ncbi:hypothetical protein GCM10010349_21300 [Streptomyces flavofungini]|nr:hypothetical protein GCM10010349_21300 [Streptomyces flavofungini]
MDKKSTVDNASTPESDDEVSLGGFRHVQRAVTAGDSETDGPHPGADAPHSGADAARPGADAAHPGADAARPGTHAPRPVPHRITRSRPRVRTRASGLRGRYGAGKRCSFRSIFAASACSGSMPSTSQNWRR